MPATPPSSPPVTADAAPYNSGLRSRSQRAKAKQKPAEALEREQFIKPYLTPIHRRPTPIRDFFRTQFYRFVLFVIHTIFKLYLFARWTFHQVLNRSLSILYYHHRTPQLIQKDVKEITQSGKMPTHLSVVLELENDALDVLIDEVSELVCWCAAAGIPRVSVYERTGVLKAYISTSHRAISTRMRAYFGRGKRTLRIYAPHARSYPEPATVDREGDGANADIEVFFVSEEDGRESLVDLTKTLCDMAQRGKISAEDVGVNLIDAEFKDNVMDEPQLLILFSSATVLKGYPPWPLRLTEIYNVQDNDSFGYQVFLRALHSFAKTEFRFGR